MNDGTMSIPVFLSICGLAVTIIGGLIMFLVAWGRTTQIMAQIIKTVDKMEANMVTKEGLKVLSAEMETNMTKISAKVDTDITKIRSEFASSFERAYSRSDPPQRTRLK